MSPYTNFRMDLWFETDRCRIKGLPKRGADVIEAHVAVEPPLARAQSDLLANHSSESGTKPVKIIGVSIGGPETW